MANTIHNIRHYEVIVLGAGMSGLSCAARLYENDYFRSKPNSLLVLEARNRVGGRINSVEVNGCRLDTGANWIHGIGTKEKPNPLMEVLPHKRYRKLAGGVAFRAPDDSDELMEEDGWINVKSALNSKPQGELVIPAKYSAPLQAFRWNMMDDLHELASSTPAQDAKQTTMLQALTKLDSFREAFDQLPKELHKTLSGSPQFLEVMEAAPLVAQSAEQERGVAGMSLSEFAIDDFDGDQVFLLDGYTAVVEEVAKKLIKDGLVETDTRVQKIHWDESPIVVETNRGTFSADQVVCTLPLGVLQHSQDELFQPALPTPKRIAIDSLGFGTLDKIFLIYSSPWWKGPPFSSILAKGTTDTESPDGFTGFTTALPGLSISSTGAATPGPRLFSVINLHNLTGFPVLMAFVSCANAVQIEAMTDAQAGGIVHGALTSWFGIEPPQPEGGHVTRWAQDEFSRGSYSHMITGLSELKHREEFQSPALSRKGGVLRFAGEHTSRNHFATVHGALLSGWREADAILKEIGVE